MGSSRRARLEGLLPGVDARAGRLSTAIPRRRDRSATKIPRGRGRLVRRLWIALGLVCLVEFALLGWIGVRIYQEMPPIPERVVASDGTVVAQEGEVERGQGVWSTLGGMDVGSVGSHGG